MVLGRKHVGSARIKSRPEKPCPKCHETIARDAKRCRHCQAPLDLSGKLGTATTVLSLAVALISVSGAFLPALINRIHTPSSEIKASILDDDEGTLIVAVTNAGERPAIISGGDYRTALDPMTQIGGAYTYLAEPVVIDGFKTEAIKLSLRPESFRSLWRTMLAEDSATEQHVAVMPSGGVFGWTSGRYAIHVRNFDGSNQRIGQNIWLTCSPSGCMWALSNPRALYRGRPRPDKGFAAYLYQR